MFILLVLIEKRCLHTAVVSIIITSLFTPPPSLVEWPICTYPFTLQYFSYIRYDPTYNAREVAPMLLYNTGNRVACQGLYFTPYLLMRWNVRYTTAAPISIFQNLLLSHLLVIYFVIRFKFN